MRKPSFLPILVILLALLVSLVSAETIQDVFPRVTAEFGEMVSIPAGSVFFLNTVTGQAIPAKYPPWTIFQPGSYKYSFEPSAALPNGNYEFVLIAKDPVGNSQEFRYSFNVLVPETMIILMAPNSIGYSKATPFNVTVFTNKISTCKYSGVALSGFNDIKGKLFDITGNETSHDKVAFHIIKTYDVKPDFPKRLYVVCNDRDGRDVFKDFLMHTDPNPPTIDALFTPSPVAEYPETGPLSSTLRVFGSEPVQCRYTPNINHTYQDMIVFPGFDTSSLEAFQTINEATIGFPEDTVKSTFTYYVQCEDRAGHLSPKLEKKIDVDLTLGLSIRVNSPAKFSQDTAVLLNVTTNKRSYCMYTGNTGSDPTSFTDPDAALSTDIDNLDRTHFKDLGVRSSGNYTVTVLCIVPEGVGFEAQEGQLTYTFIIDTNPPAAPVVNALSPICDNVLTAGFFATDSQSGISHYNWMVGGAGEVFNNGTSESGNVSVSNYASGASLNLTADMTYVFSVTAVDGAGNEGPAGVSNTITVDPTGQSCDRTPPRVWVEKSNYSSDITIMCEDDKSGCSSMDSYYGTSYTEPCEPFQYYLPPVTVGLFQSTIVCWNITDLAGNRAVGGETVILNGSAGIEAFTCDGGIDSDGDGFGERCNAGPDCDDTDPSIQIGCPNGCIMDLDGDGYGIGCDAGNDCNGRDETLTTECPNGCISDNDGDEYGLGCINGPDCKGDDSTLTTQCPNGCRDDNDGDQYGLNCPAGLDCNGEDLNQRVSCDNYCIQDTDGDGYGIGCSNGLDCNGADPMQTVGCLNGCTFDEDGDEYGLGCLNGPDCSGLDRLMFTGCPNGCEVDNDGDAHGWGCDYGADCDDTNTNVDLDCTATTNCIYDHDGDGFGLGCAQGPDCDDFSKAVTSVECTENCTYDADCNGLPDYWQEKYFNNTVCTDINVCGPDADPDGDGMSNMAEYRRGSDPTVKDEVEAPPIVVEEKKEDADEDGMPDACELRYGLNPQDPFDAEQDPDGDTLNNKFECTFDGGACAGKWLNPKNADTDNDGYADNVEFELNFDPCDPESHPSKSRVWLILFILGLLMVLGSVGYLIYKKYYIPLVSPPESPKPAKPVAKPGPAKPAEPPKHVVPTHLVHHPIHKPRPKPTGPLLSREKFMEEARRRAEEREKLFSKFGAKHEHRAEETMKEIARRPGDIHRVHIPHRAVPGHPVRPAPAAVRKVPEKPAAAAEHKMGPDHVEKLTRIIGPDYFDRISDMTKKEADYFGKLATIVKEKEIPLEKQYVDKLAKITKEVKAEGEAEPKEVTEAFRRTDIDKLDEFLNSRKKVTTFLKEYAKEEVEVEKKQAAEKDEFARLEGIGSGKKADFDALEDLSPKKRDDVLSSLEDLNTKKAQETALSKMSQLSEAESKEEIFNTFKRMSREKHVDKDVFAVLLDYMLKSGKITKHDVSELLLKLEEDGVLDKQDVASVFFSLGIKR